MNLELREWHNTGTFVVDSFSDVHALLEDQLIKLQSMRADPYVAAVESRLSIWQARLESVQVSAISPPLQPLHGLAPRRSCAACTL